MQLLTVHTVFSTSLLPDKRSFWILFILLTTFLSARSQRYDFRNYSVEQGLIQSEASGITQDKDGFLWVATYGGVSRFDGKGFVNSSKADGLRNSFCIAIHADKKNKIWVGTQTGLSVFDGRKYHNYHFSNVPQDNFITHIAEDAKGDVWVLAGFGKQLLHFANSVYTNEQILPGKFIITAIATDLHGVLWAAVFKKGIYQLIGNKWQLVAGVQSPLGDTPVQDLYFGSNNTLWIASRKGVHSFLNGVMKEAAMANESNELKSARSVAEDKEGVIWVATNNGAYSIRNGSVKHFDSERGLTDKTILRIFRDTENNIWFATDGDGLYRYSGDMFTYFDKSSGLGGSLIMGLAEDKQKNMWMGVREKSLIRYDGNNIQEFNIPGGNPAINRTNSLFRDMEGNIWIGTSGNGVWVYNGKNFKQVTAPKNVLNIVNVIWQDAKKRIWFSTPLSCFYYERDSLTQVKEIKELTSSFQQMDNGNILIGASTGIYAVNNENKVSKIRHPALDNISVFSLGRRKNELLIGTSDQGLIAWNLQTDVVKTYATKQGMSSDFIYSILVDNNSIWCGTGRGLNRIQVTDTGKNKGFRVKVYTPADGLTGLECNMGVITKDVCNRIWFGTNKGAFIYNPLADTIAKFPPHLVLQSVKLFSEQIKRKPVADTLQSWYLLPDKLVLAANENHLTFQFSAISLSSPDSMRYQYFLEGLEREYSTLSNTPFVVYSGLPFGKYTFRVKAFTKEGIAADNEIAYSFEIIAPFYKTGWFQLFAILFLVATGIAIQWIIAGWQQRKKRFLQNLRDEEQNKIRQRTSEDFHDEMGNKLTRIAVLSDILESKLDERAYEKNLVQQIRSNAGALYRGTKDILWSLDPSSDNFHEILNRIRDFGNELFQDTDIVFSFNGSDENYSAVKLPLDYSRNILMIFKEALNNVLKHAGCKNVSLTVTPINAEQVKIVLQDDGRGFSMDSVVKGHGIGNMQQRTARINSVIDIRPGDKGGSILSLFITFPTAL